MPVEYIHCPWEVFALTITLTLTPTIPPTRTPTLTYIARPLSHAFPTLADLVLRPCNRSHRQAPSTILAGARVVIGRNYPRRIVANLDKVSTLAPPAPNPPPVYNAITCCIKIRDLVRAEEDI